MILAPAIVAWLLTGSAAAFAAADLPLALDIPVDPRLEGSVEVAASGRVRLTLIKTAAAELPPGAISLVILPFRDRRGLEVPATAVVAGKPAVIGVASRIELGQTQVVELILDQAGGGDAVTVRLLASASGFAPKLWTVEATRAAPSPHSTFSPTATPTATPTVDPATIVTALVELGMVTDAWKKYVAETSAHPELALREVWVSQGRQLWALSMKTPELLTAYVLKPIGLVVVAVVLVWGINQRRTWALAFGDLVGGAPGSGHALVASTHAALLRMGHATPVSGPSLIINDQPIVSSAASGAAELPLPTTIASGLSSAPGAADLILQLVRPRRLVVTGALRSDQQRGAGIVVKLVDERNRRIVAATTLWHSDVSEAAGRTPSPEAVSTAPQVAASHLELAWVIAAWTYWEVYRYTYTTADRDRRLRLAFGTASFSSYRSFRAAGLTSHAPAKQRFLHAALVEDPQNRHALFSLAQADMWGDQGAAKTPQIERMFREVILIAARLTHSDLPRAALAPGTYGRHTSGITAQSRDVAALLASHQLGVLALHEYIREPQGGARSLRDCFRHFRAAWDAVTRDKRDMPDGSEGEADGAPSLTKEFRDRLAIAYANALFLAAGDRNLVSYGRPHREQARQLLEPIEANPHRSPLISYNLACYYSSVVGCGGAVGANATRHIQLACDYLVDALRAFPEWLLDLHKDPSLRAALPALNQRLEADPEWAGRVAANLVAFW